MNYEYFSPQMHYFEQVPYQIPGHYDQMERQLPNIGNLQRRISALERQSEQFSREITRLNQVVERHTRRLNRLNQRLRAVENILRIPFSALEDGF